MNDDCWPKSHDVDGNDVSTGEDVATTNSAPLLIGVTTAPATQKRIASMMWLSQKEVTTCGVTAYCLKIKAIEQFAG